MIRMISDDLYITKCNMCGKNEQICHIGYHPFYPSTYVCGNCWEKRAKQTKDMANRFEKVVKLIREQEEKRNEHK